MVGVVVETSRARGAGVQGYLRRLDGLAAQAEHVVPALEEVHKQFLATERGIFASGGIGKAKWAPLTPRYLAWKADHGRDERAERSTGALARALTTGRGEGAVTEISEAGATFGTDLARAVYAHRGHGRRRRRLITIDRRRRGRWVETIRKHLWAGVEAGK